MLPHQRKGLLLQVMLKLAESEFADAVLIAVLLIFADIVMVLMLIFADLLEDHVIQTGPRTTSTSCGNTSRS